MSNRITAQEAFVVATESYDSEMTPKVEEFLNKVYNRINLAAKKGLFTISVNIGTGGPHYRKTAELLQTDGYDVSIVYSDYEGWHYMLIRWSGNGAQ